MGLLETLKAVLMAGSQLESEKNKRYKQESQLQTKGGATYVSGGSENGYWIPTNQAQSRQQMIQNKPIAQYVPPVMPQTPQITQAFMPQATPQPTPQPTPTPQPMQQYIGGEPDYAEIERKIRSGLINYGGEKLPALRSVPAMMEAVKNYPLFRNNPYLIPQQTILETSGGKHISRPNNLLNYGVYVPEIMEKFKTMSIDDVLRATTKEMGQTGKAYRKYDTGKKLTNEELQDYAKQFEPANMSYYDNLFKGIEYFEQQ